jgi:heterodisulfide reductase subunit A
MEMPLLVLGGGVAGLSAAISAAQSKTPVILVEKKGQLGGFAAQFCCKATDACAYCGACIADEILREAQENSLIDIHLDTQLDSIEKNADGFNATVSRNGDIKELAVSAIVVATGFEPFDSKAHRTATAIPPLPDIVSAVDIESMLREEGQVLRSDGSSPRSVAFIQCVGSRSRRFGSSECSRVCCPYAIRIARRLKHQQQDCEITLFHMDLQGIRKIALDMYGQFGSEINFIRGIPSEATADSSGGVGLKYELTDTGEIKKDKYDLVVLSVGIAAGQDNETLAEMLGLERDANGFLKPVSHLKPCLSTIEGIFLAGTCSGPKNIRDSVATGRAAAHAALGWIQRKEG